MRINPTTLFVCDQCGVKKEEPLNFSGQVPKHWWLLQDPGVMDSLLQLCGGCGMLLAAVAKTSGRIKELGVNPPDERSEP